MVASLDAELIVLAAGKSSRAGAPKGLVVVGGRPWLERQLEDAGAAGTRLPVLVLSPAGLPLYRDAVPRLHERAIVVVNPEPDRGPFSSLQCGLSALDAAARPVFVLPVDVPAPAPEVWLALRAALAADQAAAVPTQDGRGGHPVLLGPTLLARLRSLPAEGRLDRAIAAEGLERVARVPVADPRVQMNLNTLEDWRKVRA